MAGACAEYVAAEQVVLDYCKSEEVSVAGFGEARAEMCTATCSAQ